MRHGDLDNTPVPRLVIVFENAVGYLPDDRRDRWAELKAARDWDGMAGLFELDPMLLRKITDLTYRFSVAVDVVVYCGPEPLAEAVARRLDRENVPVRIVFSSTPERMSRRTSYEPDIMAVYDANPGHQLAYGRKGRYLEDYRQLGG
jgi:hypothetical protein